MANQKKGLSLYGFDAALVNLKKGKRANRHSWQREYQHLRIDDTGLGNAGEFIRVDMQGRPNRYLMAAEDLLADDWILL